MNLNESRSLVPVKCYYNAGMDVFVFIVNHQTLNVKTTDEDLARIFRQTQMKDEETEPRSVRGKTYMEMVAAIKNGTDHVNYLWSNHVDGFIEACRLVGTNGVSEN